MEKTNLIDTIILLSYKHCTYRSHSRKGQEEATPSTFLVAKDSFLIHFILLICIESVFTYFVLILQPLVRYFFNVDRSPYLPCLPYPPGFDLLEKCCFNNNELQ